MYKLGDAVIAAKVKGEITRAEKDGATIFVCSSPKGRTAIITCIPANMRVEGVRMGELDGVIQKIVWIGRHGEHHTDIRLRIKDGEELSDYIKIGFDSPEDGSDLARLFKTPWVWGKAEVNQALATMEVRS